VLQICQKTNSNLEQIAKRQDRLEEMIKKQSKKIDAILSKIEERDNAEVVASKSKGKIKGRRIKSNFIK
jgi:predicted P-loop ATPase/GTPase